MQAGDFLEAFILLFIPDDDYKPQETKYVLNAIVSRINIYFLFEFGLKHSVKISIDDVFQGKLP